MAESSQEIVSRIEGTRQALEANFEELETRVKAATDWRHHYEQHALTWVGAALLGGAVLGLSSARPSAHRSGLDSGATPRQRSRMGSAFVGLLDDATGVLLGVAASKIQAVIADVVPGFREEFDRRHPAQRAGPISPS